MLENFTNIHFLGCTLMLSIMILGSYFFPTIDPVTLKPSDDFPSWLQTLSYYTNIPIKSGMLHFLLYAGEIFLINKTLFFKHFGQRLTTLWLQLFENPRWGQHFHMQTEGLLQIIDIFVYLQKQPEDKKINLNKILQVFAFIFMFTNFVTSSAYHTLQEQVIGAIICYIKIFFDYSHFEHVNYRIGSTFQLENKLSFILALVFTIGLYFIYPTIASHPTFYPSIVFIINFSMEKLGVRNKEF
eukprot:snap_masked-scaffold_50-processed-gene-1.49-mRNA-1 protein AED:0.06 eAED:0.06 QI:0/0/0/1/1/1/2/0/241